MKILLTGGGTGGHLAIARALRDEAISQGHTCIYVGSVSGQDRSWFEGDKAFEDVHFLNTTGVVNKRGLGKFAALFKSINATFSALGMVRGADCVVSVGGFSAAPASFAAILLRKPFFIHEQNAAIGRLNRLLRPFARVFFSSYEPQSPVKDYPVRKSFFEVGRERNVVRTVIFLGGSQGARFINELALKLAPLLKEKQINIIHHAGASEFARVKVAYEGLGIDADVFDFRSDLDQLMAKSDLAVSRSGASTLWELSATRLPALFIPYPYAAGDHQYYNAMFLLEHEAGWVCRQEEDVEGQLLALLGQSMGEASRKLGTLIHPDGAKKIIEEVSKC